MNTAQLVVSKFGGQSALADLLGKSQSAISYWCKNGTIPSKWHSKLIQLAADKGMDLSAGDFLAQPSVADLEVLNGEKLPKATHWGEIEIAGVRIPCYNLDNGIRAFSLKAVVVGLIGTKGGQLAEYIKVKALQPYLPEDLIPQGNEIPALFKFDTGGDSVVSKYALGLNVEKFMDLCISYSTALQDHLARKADVQLTARQIEIAQQATAFLRASAKTGIVALVDEATGYQYDRAADALRMKMKLFLEEEMRKWEKTFPDQLWVEFGRLTKWKGSLHQRPKYWGKLVMELVYGYLDPDVAKWLKENAPKPQTGQNYHQWLSAQYGLKRLIEHIWMLVGMASACSSMPELRQKMAEKFGRIPVQMTLFLPAQMVTLPPTPEPPKASVDPAEPSLF